MAYSPLAIANEFIRLSARGLDHMKLQKLVYYVFEEGIKAQNNILNENPQVWKYGPVFPSLYEEMKHHGSDAVQRPESEGGNGPVPDVEGDEKAIKLIKKVWEQYKGFTAIQLSSLTHNPGTPWYKIVDRLKGRVPRGTEITPKDV